MHREQDHIKFKAQSLMRGILWLRAKRVEGLSEIEKGPNGICSAFQGVNILWGKAQSRYHLVIDAGWVDVIKKLRYSLHMLTPDTSLKPDWDEDNINHIAVHGIRPEQVEEVYYSEGPFPTLAIKKKRKRGKSTEYRYRLWGTDASGFCIEVVVAPYPQYGLWRCVTAFPMLDSTKKIYFKRSKK